MSVATGCRRCSPPTSASPARRRSTWPGPSARCAPTRCPSWRGARAVRRPGRLPGAGRARRSCSTTPTTSGTCCRPPRAAGPSSTVQYAALARVTGPGLLASAEPTWIEHRRLGRPGLPPPAARRGQRPGAGSGRRRPSRPAAGDRSRAAAVDVDVADLMHRIALDAVGRALFSADLSGHAQQLLDATSDAAELVVRLGRSILPTAEWAPTPTNLRLRAARRRLDAISAGSSRSGGARPAVGGVHARRRPARPAPRQRPDRRRDPRRAGHDGHRRPRDRRRGADLDPDAARRAPARAGAGARRARRPPPARFPLLDHRERLPWTRAVIDEALRLFPPAWAISRRSEQADVVGGVAVPAGHPGHHQPVARCTAARTRGPTRWPSGPSASSTRARRAAATCPSGRDRGCASAATSRSGEMVVVLGRLLADPPDRAAAGLDAPGAAGPGRGAPARRHAAPAHPARRTTRHDRPRRSRGRPAALPRRRRAGCCCETCGRVPAGARAPDVRRPRCRSSSRRATRRRTCPRCWRRCAGSPSRRRGRRGRRRLPRRDSAAVARAARRAGPGPPARRRRAGRARPGPATSAPKRPTASCCSSSTPTRCCAPDALAGLLELHDRHGGLVSVQPYHRVLRPYEQLSAYFNVVSLMASAAFTRRPVRHGRWPSGPAC